MQSINSPLQFVFVYGTLKRGFGLNQAMGDSEFLGTATLPGYAMIHLGGFPGIVPDHTATPVTGEVYLIDPDTMKTLDRIESEGKLYIRKKEKVLFRDFDLVEPTIGGYWNPTKWVEAWVYVYNEHRSVTPHSIISGGEWL